MDEHFAPEGHSHGPRFLLLGAGFSRNWGGWLASEVFEYLLGTPEVLADDGLRTHLWNYRLGGFEDAINELQRAILASAERPEDSHSYSDWGSNNTLPLRDHLGKLQTAVNRMFADMNKAITREFELHRGNRRFIGKFLARFDAIFTLNQDLLLERLYVRELEQGSGGRWKGACLPGMRQGDHLPEARDELHFWSDYNWHPHLKEEFKVVPEMQPIFKLHGSTNWSTVGGNPMMIIGGEKARAIEQFDVLRWYAEEFERLMSDGARLMIIGYGFRDKHINDAMIRAAKNGLKLFVVDPYGSELDEKADAWNQPSTSDVHELFKQSLIGASRRNIAKTLAGEGGAENTKLLRFFST